MMFPSSERPFNLASADGLHLTVTPGRKSFTGSLKIARACPCDSKVLDYCRQLLHAIASRHLPCGHGARMRCEHEQLYAASEDLPGMEGLITHNVSGERFQAIEDLVRRKGDTLLTKLLDDPAGNTDEEGAIVVKGNPKLFPLILDWYRYGKILLPPSVSKSQITRECAFYQLPEGELHITRERVADLL
eukprot:4311767-Amphidinium_carterae.1